MPCCPFVLCRFELNVFEGPSKDPAALLWKMQACQMNCHTCCGKQYGCCCDVAKRMNIDIFDKHDRKIGNFEKEYFGLVNECFNHADKYNFDYPSTKPEHMAIFLSAIAFIDMLYFENNYCGAGGV